MLTAALIIAFCILQALYRPLEPAAGINAVIDRAALAITVAFTLELAAKAVAWGLVLDDGESAASLWRSLRRGCRQLLSGLLRPQGGNEAQAAKREPSCLGGIVAAAAPTAEPPHDPAAAAAAAAGASPCRTGHDVVPGAPGAATPGAAAATPVRSTSPHVAVQCSDEVPPRAAKAGSSDQLGVAARTDSASAFEGKASGAAQATPDERLPDRRAVLVAKPRGPLLRSPWGLLDAALVLASWVT